VETGALRERDNQKVRNEPTSAAFFLLGFVIVDGVAAGAKLLSQIASCGHVGFTSTVTRLALRVFTLFR
jgi:hypothetical protein